MIRLAAAPLPAQMCGARAGLGFGLVFPALGVELMKRVPAPSHGGAFGIYTVFLDLALAFIGPAAALSAVADIGLVAFCRPRSV